MSDLCCIAIETEEAHTKIQRLHHVGYFKKREAEASSVFYDSHGARMILAVILYLTGVESLDSLCAILWIAQE